MNLKWNKNRIESNENKYFSFSLNSKSDNGKNKLKQIKITSKSILT